MQTNWVLAAVTVPAIAALTLTSEQVVGILFGDRWQPVAPIFAWLGHCRPRPAHFEHHRLDLHLPGQDEDHVPLGHLLFDHDGRCFYRGLAVGCRRRRRGLCDQRLYAACSRSRSACAPHRPGDSDGLLLVQGLFIVSALLAWLAYWLLPLSLIARSDFLAVILAVLLNYAFAFGLLAFATPVTQRSVGYLVGKLASNIR